MPGNCDALFSWSVQLLSCCCGTHLLITGVSRCFMNSASLLAESGADNQSVQLLAYPCANNQNAQSMQLCWLASFATVVGMFKSLVQQE